MIWLSLAFCFSGFAALCLSMDRHHKQVFGEPAPRLDRWMFRLGGWATLAISCVPTVLELGPSIGISLWVTLLSVAGLMVVLLLSYRPRLMVALAFAGPSITLPALLF